MNINGISFYQGQSVSHCNYRLGTGEEQKWEQSGDGLKGAWALKTDVFGVC